MNRHTVVRLLAAAALVAGACSKDTGKDGAQGPQGPAGASCTVAANGNGTKTITCTDGTSVTVSDGAAGADGVSCTLSGPAGAKVLTCSDGTSAVVADGTVDFSKLNADELAALDMSAVITAVDHTNGKPVVSFKVSDHLGKGVRGLSATAMRFAVLKLVAATNGGNDTWVSYMANNATTVASTETGTAAQLVDNGDGSYAYTFARDVKGGPAATTFDASANHRVVLIMNASGNPYAPVNATLDYVPASGALADQTALDKVSGATCLECHGSFRAPARGTGAFHGGARYDVKVCVACHNDQKRFSSSGAALLPTTVATDGSFVYPTQPGASTPDTRASVLNGEAVVNLPVFIHKIHMGEELGLKGSASVPATYAGVPKLYETHYPQVIQNCTKCHKNAGQADNYKTKPSRRACGSCHDTTVFTSPAATPLHTHANFFPYADDSACATCHASTQPGMPSVLAVHLKVTEPATPNYLQTKGLTGATTGNPNTNAAWMAAAGSVPAGASAVSYDLSSVSVASGKIVVKFKLKKDGANVTFPSPWVVGTSELIAGFVGSPSIQYAFSVPQDGIAAPSDFNVQGNVQVKDLLNPANAASKGSITGPDSSGYYTATITAVAVPTTAKMVTAGLGYTYSLSASPPLTQVNLAAFPYNPPTATTALTNVVGPDGRPFRDLQPGEGGLIVAAQDVWKVASGYTARRAIATAAKCNACHEQLGVGPNFHAGQRNDGASCNFCHNPNQTSSGWSANASSFIHGIHGASKRTVDFNWHAPAAGQTYAEVTYPGVLNKCEQCHVPGSYDFSASASATAAGLTEGTPASLLASTVGTGKYNSDPTTNPTGWFSISPYVTADNVTDYGAGFSFNKTTGVITEAAQTTLVMSPITAACSSCHDSLAARQHMTQSTGSFYVPRSAVVTEQCLECHGPGSIVSIANVHR